MPKKDANREALESCLSALIAAESAITWADICTDGKALNPAIYRIISMAKLKAERQLKPKGGKPKNR